MSDEGLPVGFEAGEAGRESAGELEPSGWVLLYDPRWDPRYEQGEAPGELIAGGWPVLEGGEVGPFHVNELHRAASGADPGSPADPDPVGAALELVADGRAPLELVQLVLSECAVQVGMNADGRPLVVRSLDDRLCLLAATCEERRAESSAPEWERFEIEGLAALVDEGLDVLFNPAGPLPMRLGGQLVRAAANVGDEQAAAVFESLLDHRPNGLFGSEDVQPAG